MVRHLSDGWRPEAGVNLPPIRTVKVITRAKPRIDMFALKDGANQLKDNPKFERMEKTLCKRKGKRACGTVDRRGATCYE